MSMHGTRSWASLSMMMGISSERRCPSNTRYTTTTDRWQTNIFAQSSTTISPKKQRESVSISVNVYEICFFWGKRVYASARTRASEARSRGKRLVVHVCVQLSAPTQHSHVRRTIHPCCESTRQEERDVCFRVLQNTYGFPTWQRAQKTPASTSVGRRPEHTEEQNK